MGGMGGVLHDTFCFAGASCKENIQDGGGREAPMIFAAVFTVRWRVLRSAAQQFPYQTVMQLVSTVVNLVLLKCRKLRREDQETSDWIVSRILLLRTQAVGICSHRNLNLK